MFVLAPKNKTKTKAGTQNAKQKKKGPRINIFLLTGTTYEHQDSTTWQLTLNRMSNWNNFLLNKVTGKIICDILDNGLVNLFPVNLHLFAREPIH